MKQIIALIALIFSVNFVFSQQKESLTLNVTKRTQFHVGIDSLYYPDSRQDTSTISSFMVSGDFTMMAQLNKDGSVTSYYFRSSKVLTKDRIMFTAVSDLGRLYNIIMDVKAYYIKIVGRTNDGTYYMVKFELEDE